jgi:hypothetical protein
MFFMLHIEYQLKKNILIRSIVHQPENERNSTKYICDYYTNLIFIFIDY